MFTCIYCLKNEPEVFPSEAHIFPDAMGGVSSTHSTVCKECNLKINKRFEQNEIKKFAFFQSIWGIHSRRRKVQGVPSIVDYEGRQFKTSLDNRGMPKSPLVFVEKNDEGKNVYHIIGPSVLVERKQKEIDRKKPIGNWKEKDLTNIQPPESIIDIASDIARPTLRRLAAKVAYERWVQIRSAILINDRQYENIRDFIINGTEKELCCGLLDDNHLLNGMLNFPVGHHGVVIIANPRSRVLGSFVTFYSLFYFWVILSHNFNALAAIDHALIEDPQGQKIFEPIFRTGTGNILVHWNHVVSRFVNNPIDVENSAMKYLINKFRIAANEFYESKKL